MNFIILIWILKLLLFLSFLLVLNVIHQGRREVGVRHDDVQQIPIKLRLQREIEILELIAPHDFQKIKRNQIHVGKIPRDPAPKLLNASVVHAPAPPEEIVVALLHLLVVLVVLGIDQRQNVDLVRHLSSAVVQMTHHRNDEGVGLVGVVGVLRVEPHEPRDEHIGREERVRVAPVQHREVGFLLAAVADGHMPVLLEGFEGALDVLRR